VQGPEFGPQHWKKKKRKNRKRKPKAKKQNHHKKGLVEWLKVGALSSNLSTTKKKRFHL
jgi:hypothetical protein